MTILWQGKVVTENRWHVVRNGRIAASREYEKFIDGLAWTIKAECRDTKLERIDHLWLDFQIGAKIDKQNLLKPICDALKRSGLIEDDNHQIGYITLLPAAPRQKTDQDMIWLFVKGT